VDFTELFAFFQRHAVLSLGLAVVTVALVYTEIARLFRPYKSATPRQLVQLINAENALVVDVSALVEFEKGHIVGSKHLLPSQFDPGAKLFAGAQERPVAVVDRVGMASGEIAAKLGKAGFKRVYWLDGGLAAWTAADLPLAKGRA
jgi:rhodanese-related sulfurtransferase